MNRFRVVLVGLIGLLLSSAGAPRPALAVEGEDVSAKAEVTFSPLKLAKKGGLYETTAIVRNASAAPLFGPVSLIVTGLNATGISLPGARGRTPSGEPFVNVVVPSGGLAPGKTAKPAVLRFAGASSPDFSFGHAVFGFVAAPIAVPTLPRIDVRLSAAVTAPGERITATWKIVGQSTAKTKLQVRVRAPGGSSNVVGKQWIHHGLAPATGALSYLATNGKWSDKPVLRRPAKSGRLKVTFPTPAVGAWSVEVLLLDKATGATLVSGSRTVLVGDEPGIYLRINRPIANNLDIVRATLTTTAGATPRPVRLLAWLVKPDGSQVGLPGLAPGGLEVFSGTSRSEEIRLLDSWFDTDALGAYQVQVRLFDATTRALISRASAGFEVSDTTAPLTGVVLSAAGTPLDGTTAIIADVQALDVDDLAVTASATPDTAGAYSMTLAPGRYLLTATVMDAAGVHRAESASLVQIDAAGTARTLDLQAAAPTPGLAAKGATR